jgi:flagellar hook-basal body complex protein FliE
MAITPVSALNAYAAAARAGQSAPGASGGAGGASPLSEFASLLEGSVKSAETQMNNAEQLTAQAAVGKAELVDVVTAIAAAETSLETMLAVRDEVIRAYQDIMRMPI